MSVEEIAKTEELRSLIEDYRSMCFWNVAEDFMPKDRGQILFALDAVEHYGDLNGYRRAGRIRQWLLESNGITFKPLRELKTFLEAEVERNGVRTEIQWGIDSTYRFFPIVEDPVAGYTLHPLDLAANKLSALVGRTEPRDWIDVITAMRKLQPLACLLSAACGKDPGFSPTSMLEYVARRHYNQVEIDEKILPKGAYDAAELCRYWHEAVDRTREVLAYFPHSEAGKAVVNADGTLFNGTDEELVAALKAGTLEFHEGRIGGAWPRIIR